MTWAYFNGTGVQDLLLYGNSVTRDYFGLEVVIGIFFVSFITLKNFYSTEKCMVTATFLTFVLSGFLWSASVIDYTVFLPVTIVFFLSAGYFLIVGE